MDQRTRKSPARFVAPLALIATVIVLFAMVSGSGGSADDSKSDGATATKTASGQSKAKKTRKTGTTQTGTPTGPATYTVKIGDTFLGIAAKTGVPAERIQELNPAADSSQLRANQKLKLR